MSRIIAVTALALLTICPTGCAAPQDDSDVSHWGISGMWEGEPIHVHWVTIELIESDLVEKRAHVRMTTKDRTELFDGWMNEGEMKVFAKGPYSVAALTLLYSRRAFYMKIFLPCRFELEYGVELSLSVSFTNDIG